MLCCICYSRHTQGEIFCIIVCFTWLLFYLTGSGDLTFCQVQIFETLCEEFFILVIFVWNRILEKQNQSSIDRFHPNNVQLCIWVSMCPELEDELHGCTLSLTLLRHQIPLHFNIFACSFFHLIFPCSCVNALSICVVRGCICISRLCISMIMITSRES